MASRDINDLVPDFKSKVQTLLEKCAARGIEMRPNETLRSPFEQAKYWRQSRSMATINRKIEEFRSAGADFLAFCLESVGPQSGDPVTNAAPGLSWHQWGEALDCFWVVDGEAEWSTTRRVDGLNGYWVYATEAEELGLTAGGFWRSIKDWPHVQLKDASGPQKIFTITEINDEMKRRFS